MWPNYDSVTKRCEALYNDFKGGKDIQKYTTTGAEDKKLFGASKTSTMKKNTLGGSPSRSPDANAATSKQTTFTQPKANIQPAP